LSIPTQMMLCEHLKLLAQSELEVIPLFLFDIVTHFLVGSDQTSFI
jgi:hypothetical protein